ncbi:hypothetical protein Kpol_1054p12 [Vanderwaltozyma polyspora DSM 70294]|uniref:Integrase catalytic domain-containing protein n=1 Tax=Vanderwaltozyma polyspora (strain ATCC 22028 / DSM 70294 / BCRC 21397 / CBS 2163 / NBRC 10782 / NRRL Y-8283 / UCD 57-17) TaxID=436907 RepID=A7TIA0_VANPO|nr:uncharacterized protein Kpol_1054p12 [Vanderwaltozyma polyspora DSM 70294]EDO17966.1 hypothetical protein Kpol_1054p12 [Vanderwaltozyma polyspora DSM 70294]
MPECDGYRYLLLARCTFTSWLEALPRPTISGAVIAAFIEFNFHSRYGFIPHITTDGGSEFKNDIMSALTTHLHITHRTTAAYHPQSNGFIESQHKSFVHVLQRLPGPWFNNTSNALLADRWTVKRSTGYTPGYLVFGYHGFSSLDSLLYSFSTFDFFTTVSSYSLLYYRAQQFLFREAASSQALAHLSRHRLKMKEYYDLVHHTTDHSFAVGDIVLVEDQLRKRNIGRSRKAISIWCGPYRISKVLKHIYQLEELYGTRIHRHFPPEFLKIFQSRPGFPPILHSGGEDSVGTSSLFYLDE